jgi:catechol 2,3-dioxygenase-like lactoylglutathione lyase family enzyme
MPLSSLDHVNIRTARVAAMRAFYEEVLGLRTGPRPPFSFDGAWLYCGGSPVVHLVDVAPDEAPTRLPQAALGLSHFAFAATGLAELVGRLRAAAVAHGLRTVPGSGVQQVFLEDPDGNVLHVDFAADERAP